MNCYGCKLLKIDLISFKKFTVFSKQNNGRYNVTIKFYIQIFYI